MYTLPEERIKTLLRRYLEDTLTTAERQELSDLILRYPQVWELLQEMESEGLVPSAFQKRQEVEMESGLSRIRTRILKTESVPLSLKDRLWKFAWVPAAAIATISAAVLILSANAGKSGRQKPSGKAIAVKAIQTIQVTNDRSPGGNRATLITSDGRSIRLDSLPVGNSPVEGGAGAVKRDSGTLSYAEATFLSRKVREDPERIGYNMVTTPRGGQFLVILPDGSKAMLNNGSSIRYPTAFAGNTREVTVSGEVYLEVFRNPSQPFKAIVKKLSVDVLGTSINIQAYDSDHTTTTVIEGKIRVQEGSRKRVLEEREQVFIRKNKDWVFRQEVNMERVTGWKNGRFNFTGTPLSEVLDQLERWYDIEVVNTLSANPVYHASIRRSNPLSTVLDCLEADQKEILFRIDGRKLLVH